MDAEVRLDDVIIDPSLIEVLVKLPCVLADLWVLANISVSVFEIDVKLVAGRADRLSERSLALWVFQKRRDLVSRD